MRQNSAYERDGLARKELTGGRSLNQQRRCDAKDVQTLKDTAGRYTGGRGER